MFNNIQLLNRNCFMVGDFFRPQGWWWSAYYMFTMKWNWNKRTSDSFPAIFWWCVATIYVSRTRIFEATKGHVRFLMTQLSSNDQKVLQDVSTSFYLRAAKKPKCCQLWKKNMIKSAQDENPFILPCQLHETSGKNLGKRRKKNRNK